MPAAVRLPSRFPAGTKYVLEAHGKLVRRYVEFADGHRLELEPRKALTCRCAAQRAHGHEMPAHAAA
ncbi:MAG: hypothetical protein ACRD1F_11030 [Terriglobales bacterium]